MGKDRFNGEEPGSAESEILQESSIEQVKAQVLDAYLDGCLIERPSYPEGGATYVKEMKTTIEIINEVAETMDLTKDEINKHLSWLGYQIGKKPDGTPAWVFWMEWKTD